MLVNFWYISSNLQDNCINIYQLADEFGDNIPKFMKLEGGTYIFCLSPNINVYNMCHIFGYNVEGNPIPVIIESNKYNKSYKVDKNFSLTSCEES
jgi:hypothetical protein